jgi:hypothetical protein
MIKIKGIQIERNDIVEIGKNPDNSYYFKIKKSQKYEDLLFDLEVVEISGKELFVKMFKLNLEYNEIYVLATTTKEIDLQWLPYATIDHAEIIQRIKDLFFEFAVDVKIIEAPKEDERE